MSQEAAKVTNPNYVIFQVKIGKNNSKEYVYKSILKSATCICQAYWWTKGRFFFLLNVF